MQQQVAIAVAHHVVHAGKVIHVNQHHALTVGAGLHGGCDVVNEPGTVGQAQQRVHIGFGVQTLHQRQVAQTGVQVDAKHIEQAAIHLAQRLAAAHVGSHVQPALFPEVQRGLGGPVLRPAFIQALAQQLRRPGVVQALQRLVNELHVLPCGCQHTVLAPAALPLGTHQTLWLHAQNGGHLGDDARRKIAQPLRLQE